MSSNAGVRKTKTILNIILGRLGVITMSIVIQALFFICILLYLSSQAFVIYFGLQMISVGVVLWIMGKRDNPSYKIPWILLILAFPLVGGISYLMFGNKHIPRKLRKKMEMYYNNDIKGYTAPTDAKDKVLPAEYNANLRRQAEYISDYSGFPAWTDTACEFYPLGDDMFPRLVEELKKAEKFILMEYFIIDDGLMWSSILNVLKERAAAGVDVYLMYDDMGTIQTLPGNYANYLRSLGLKVTIFNPYRPHLNLTMNYRDHRKITVIDGNIGFCGGINLADEYINEITIHGHWKDTAVMLDGKAVMNLTALFITLWNFSNEEYRLDFKDLAPTRGAKADGYVQPFGDSPLDDENVGQSFYLNMINRATDYIHITTPYLIVDNETITALVLAAKSGVDVTIVTPHVPDKWPVHWLTQSCYGQLIEAGVKVYEYTPGYIHAKEMVSDDQIAIVGTINMDYRSLYLNFECGVAFYNSSMVEKVKQDIAEILPICTRITLEDTILTNPVKRVIISIFKIFAPLA